MLVFIFRNKSRLTVSALMRYIPPNILMAVIEEILIGALVQHRRLHFVLVGFRITKDSESILSSRARISLRSIEHLAKMNTIIQNYYNQPR